MKEFTLFAKMCFQINKGCILVVIAEEDKTVNSLKYMKKFCSFNYRDEKKFNHNKIKNLYFLCINI